MRRLSWNGMEAPRSAFDGSFKVLFPLQFFEKFLQLRLTRILFMPLSIFVISCRR
jgi:hypothetical protein